MNSKISAVASQIRNQINKVLIGKETIIDYVLAAYFAGGHILLEDMPGTGKTMLAKVLAKSVDGEFKRVQFTPDLLPSDVTGLNYYNQEKGKFEFRQGPVFANILLADEINRAAPRTQSSLLEGMGELQVTIDGTTRCLPNNFFVIATQNPIETLGTFSLPEAQLDRFMMKIPAGLPSYSQELEMMDRYMTDQPIEKVVPVCKLEDVNEIREMVKNIYIHNEVRKFLLNIVTATRDDKNILVGVSPRGTLDFMRATQALAAVRERNYVTPDDVKEIAPFVLGHRIVCSNNYNQGSGNQNVIRSLTSKIQPPVEPFNKLAENEG